MVEWEDHLVCRYEVSLLSIRKHNTNASHGLEYENPVEFNKIVLGFKDKQ